MSRESKHRPLFIGFGSIKGGVGKSSIAEVLASCLYYNEGVNLFVVDCDYSQYSFYNLRERDKQTVAQGGEQLHAKVRNHFEKLGRISYRILKSTSQRALKDVEAFMEEHKDERYDLVLFDLPGRADDAHLISLTVDMDYLISPIEPDPQSLVASLSYALSIRDLGVSLAGSRIKQIYMLWNKIDRRINLSIVQWYDNHIRKEQLGVMKTRLPQLARFKKEMTTDAKECFRSTYLPPDRHLLPGSSIPELMEELKNIFLPTQRNPS